MKQLLLKAVVWNVDGTLKVTKIPFTQICIIHIFVHQGKLIIKSNKKLYIYIIYSIDCTNQVPAAFIMMSVRKRGV